MSGGKVKSQKWGFCRNSSSGNLKKFRNKDVIADPSFPQEINPHLVSDY